MENTENIVKLEYNTERENLLMREYGRNVLKMVDSLRQIEDRAERSRQATAVVKVMERLNPSVKSEEHWEQKLWDHLFLIAGEDFDIDAPYPRPAKSYLGSKPLPIALKDKPVKFRHYGRNIESIIELVASEPEGERKVVMLRQLATYMRQQYLIWNKDSVADATIFEDIEKMSDHRIRVPEGMELGKLSSDQSFNRPGMNVDFAHRRNGGSSRRGNFQRKKR